MDDLLSLHRTALDDLDGLVRTVTDDDLDRPTPCAGWTVGDLLAHSIGQQRGFAAAVRAGAAEKSAYASVPWRRADWSASVGELLGAFAGADLDGSISQVELNPDQPVPTRFVVAAQLLDSAVHAWDLARALDRHYEPDPAITAPVRQLAERIPDGANRETAGAAFVHARPGDGTDWERTLLLLGRDPAWAPPIP